MFEVKLWKRNCPGGSYKIYILFPSHESMNFIFIVFMLLSYKTSCTSFFELPDFNSQGFKYKLPISVYQDKGIVLDKILLFWILLAWNFLKS